MSDSDFGPVGDPPIVQGGTDYYTTDGYGRKTWLVDRRLLDEAQARIAELEAAHEEFALTLGYAEDCRPSGHGVRVATLAEMVEPIKQAFSDARDADLAAERDRWKGAYEKATQALPEPSEYDHDTGSARWNNYPFVAQCGGDISIGAPSEQVYVLNIAEAGVFAASVNAAAARADRLESEATADDVVEKAAPREVIEDAKSLYEREGWSGCDGSSWERLSPATRDGWIYAAGLLRGES
ncbi:hypothetical protein PP512_gp56 [Gordonia phage Denise]|uniref:Uncharacterized protein n=1 Tax=Gordonia phage Denise TaxID=2652879 RepID=A0A5P8DD51_9CAUD|nr:hypothetical protein PP512_gp56 [Gordonia phage Denise]QFP96671.1 hypothetical protein SEA_DENISE_56 [Gordonia phage Denise]